MSKLLSIVIPTRNRSEVCVQSVRQVLSIARPDTEILVQDNSDTDGLRFRLQELDGADLITYHHIQGQLSFVDNFSRAVSSSTGEYLCVIGDDDGVLEGIHSAVQMMKLKGADAFVPGLNAVYYWPSTPPIVKGSEKGYLNLSYLDYTARYLDLEKGLKGLMVSAGQQYQSLDLPRLYHGIVKRECLEKVKERTGNYFGGLTPDIYMSVALANVCGRVIGLAVPITVSGVSPKSGSAQSASGEHTGKLDKAPHFQGHSGYQWSDAVPGFYSVETIWADTALHALQDFNRGDLAQGFNTTRLDAVSLIEYPQFADIIRDHMNKNGVKPWRSGLEKLKYYQRKYLKRIARRALRKKGDVVKHFDVPDIAQAARLTEQTLNLKRFTSALEGLPE